MFDANSHGFLEHLPLHITPLKSPITPWKPDGARPMGQALLPTEMPSFVKFAERYSYKQLGVPRTSHLERPCATWGDPVGNPVKMH